MAKIQPEPFDPFSNPFWFGEEVLPFIAALADELPEVTPGALTGQLARVIPVAYTGSIGDAFSPRGGEAPHMRAHALRTDRPYFPAIQLTYVGCPADVALLERKADIQEALARADLMINPATTVGFYLATVNLTGGYPVLDLTDPETAKRLREFFEKHEFKWEPLGPWEHKIQVGQPTPPLTLLILHAALQRHNATLGRKPFVGIRWPCAKNPALGSVTMLLFTPYPGIQRQMSDLKLILITPEMLP